MKECQRFEKKIEDLLAGEISPLEQQALMRHCGSCRECRRVVAMHAELQQEQPELAEPDQAELDWMREQVMERVLGDPQSSSGRLRALLSTPIRIRPLPAMGMAFAASVLMVVSGLSMARWTQPEARAEIPEIREIGSPAVFGASLAELEESPYLYSNATFRRMDGGRVALSFDLSTHIDMVVLEDSPLVREVLVQSLLNPSTLGSRLKAVSYAREIMDPKVKDALIFAMLEDDSLAVRLKSLKILAAKSADPDIEAAMLQTLKEDEAVQMRLQALEYLAEREVDPAVIRRTIQEKGLQSDPALLLQAAKYDRLSEK